MRYQRYPTVYETNDLSIFEFESVGQAREPIRKRITFSKTEVNSVYNLAFGNLGENGRLDDEAISGDRDKVQKSLTTKSMFHFEKTWSLKAFL